MDYHNNKDFSDSNTLIYGHNMANGSMFGSLKKYTEKSYWAKISISTFIPEMVKGESIKYTIPVWCVRDQRSTHTILLQKKYKRLY